jgi:hypothetical protein
MERHACAAALLLTAALCAGCVERRYVVTSEPLGALVYRNGVPIGTTPVDDHFVYYGKYHFTLVKEGYETLQVDAPIEAPWYEIPPLDFISENLIPFKIHDVRRLCFQLEPLRTPPAEEVLPQALQLRSRGQAIGAPRLPPPPAAVAPPSPGLPPIPPPTPLPPAGAPAPIPQPPLPAQPAAQPRRAPLPDPFRGPS